MITQNPEKQSRWPFWALQTSIALALCSMQARAGEPSPVPAKPAADSGLIAKENRAAQRAEELLSRMTLDEKIGQMVLFTVGGTITGPSGQREDLESQIQKGNCGAVFNAHTVAKIRSMQKLAVEKTRLGIPMLFGYDVIHGYKTIFPIPLGESASWDLKGMEDSARIAAIEATAGGLNWTYAPMVDIARDPRWGRIAEGAGEDPFLGSAIAAARVRGFQGAELGGDSSSILACVKHFAAYGAAQAGREYNTTDMSERTLREVYLPPYRAAVDAGVMSVMSSFNELNGIPATANHHLLTEILRDEWGFKGFLVTDYTAINELVNHGIATNEYDAGREALNACVDMDMQGGVFLSFLKKMVEAGDVKEAQITEAARRILRVKFMLGLFDDPYRFCDEGRETRLIYTADNLQAALRMACESMVLLKNRGGVMPLKPGAKIAVIGPLATAKQDLLGTWSGQGEGAKVEPVLDAIKAADSNGEVTYAKGCDINSSDETGFGAAVDAAKQADVAVLVLGESADMSGEASSRASIGLPGVQSRLVEEIRKTGKPVIMVLLNGRPLALEKESQLADSVLEAWHPGSKGGEAVADVLFGKYNPSGKLPVTFPRNVGQVPIYYSLKNTGRPISPAKPTEKYKSNYLDSPNDPLYPFGFGLSYTTFGYSNVKVDRDTLTSGGRIVASVTVTNSGAREGTEIVQLYIRGHSEGVTRPVRELKGFLRIELKPAETRELEFPIGEKELAFLRHDMTWGTEIGKFEVMIGPNSRDLSSARCALTAGQ